MMFTVGHPIRLIIAFMMMSTAVFAFGEKTHKVGQRRIPFYDAPLGAKNADHLAGLTVMLHTDKIQDVHTGGIRFNLLIEYNGPHQVAIYNPLDCLSVLIASLNSKYVELPPYIPRQLIDSDEPEDSKNFDLPFRFLNPLLNGRPLAKDKIKNKVLTLQAGDQLVLPIEIDKVLIRSDQPADFDRLPDPVRTPVGSYKLQVRLYLSRAFDISDSRSLETDAFRVDLSNDPSTGPLQPARIELSSIGDGANQRTQLNYTEYSFGQLSRSTKAVEHDFILRNDESTSILINKVTTSCGCILASAGPISGKGRSLMLPFSLLPGRSFRVHVVLNPSTAHSDLSNNTIWISAHGQEQPVSILVITGNVLNKNLGE